MGIGGCIGKRESVKNMWRIVGMVMLWIGCVVYLAYGQHGGWTDKYRDSKGQVCCVMERDCRPVHARIIGQNREYTTVEVDGVEYQMHSKSVHHSEDMEDWMCAGIVWHGPGEKEYVPRCVFISPKG